MIKLFFSVFLFSSSFLYTQDVASVQYARVVCSGCTVFVPFKKGMSIDEIYYEANKIYTNCVSKLSVAQRAPVSSIQPIPPVTQEEPAIEQQLMALSDSINKEFDQVMQYNSSLYSNAANMQLDKEINEKKQEEMAQREHDLKLLQFIRQIID